MSAADTDSLVLVRDVDALRRRIAAWRREHRSIALVPTMGALHRGHLVLMNRAQQMAGRVVATIFVNPTQFSPEEDFTAYPRHESEDFRLLADAGVHLLFAPDVAAMYPKGFAATVHIAGISEILEGMHRPAHFDGVATVVTKLLLQAGPDIALFGEKDYQQLILIKRLVADLNIPAEVIGVPTVREPDGLALSSRNAYLTPAERNQAPALYRALNEAAAAIAAGGNMAEARITARQRIIQAGFSRIDYLELRHAETLAPLDELVEPGRLLVAAQLGRARLLDNVPVGQQSK